MQCQLLRRNSPCRAVSRLVTAFQKDLLFMRVSVVDRRVVFSSGNYGGWLTLPTRYDLHQGIYTSIKLQSRNHVSHPSSRDVQVACVAFFNKTRWQHGCRTRDNKRLSAKKPLVISVAIRTTGCLLVTLVFSILRPHTYSHFPISPI